MLCYNKQYLFFVILVLWVELLSGSAGPEARVDHVHGGEVVVAALLTGVPVVEVAADCAAPVVTVQATPSPPTQRILKQARVIGKETSDAV